MANLSIIETPFFSVRCGELCEGCARCVRGEKLVLFVTGVCPAKCFFCPLSPEKKMVDVAFANERKLGDANTSDEVMIRELIAEARAARATGAGVTGGDPLARLGRTCAFIKALKKEFGKEFHIHLYTPLILVNEESLQKLYDAGLDEIRFHPELCSPAEATHRLAEAVARTAPRTSGLMRDGAFASGPSLIDVQGGGGTGGASGAAPGGDGTDDEYKKLWNRIELARAHDWVVGVEIPVLPDKKKEMRELVEFLNGKVDFLNLNELEISELTCDVFKARGYEVVSAESYGIKGSGEAAREIMKRAAELGLPTHYCTTTLKDRVQMGNRLLRQSEEAAKPFDEVDDEGLLTRGAIYVDELPSFGYGKKVVAGTDAKALKLLGRILSWLRDEGMPGDAGLLDERRTRILIAADALRELSEELTARFPRAKPAIVTEYPTSDAWLVLLEPLLEPLE